MRESDIVYENGDYWVLSERKSYIVMRNGNVAATSDSAYAQTPDGLSLAKARCDYLARRARDPKCSSCGFIREVCIC